VLPKWYSIANSAVGLPTVVSIYDEVGMFGVPAGEFLNDISAINGPIEMHINSPGGDVFDGLTIYNRLKQRGDISVIIDGLAASAASFIAQAADPGKLQIAPRARMMIHNGFGQVIGDAGDMRETADLLDGVTKDIASIYAERTGKPVAYWLAQMGNETWYNDQEAVDAGLADAIHGQGALKDDWDMSVFAHYAGLVLNGATVVVNADGNHASMTGTHAHSHPAYGSQGSDAVHAHEHDHDGDAAHSHHQAAPAGDGSSSTNQVDLTETWQVNKQLNGFVENASDGPTEMGSGWVKDPDGSVRFDPDGDGDDDSSPDGDTDNDYWDENGNQLQDIPPCPEASNAADDGKKAPFPGAAEPFKKKSADDRSALTVLNADVDNSPWNASKAWAAGTASDDPAKFFAGICAGRKTGDASTQAAWALPYKYSPSSPPNAAGVKNALARLPQTKGLTNADAAKATLQKAMKQVNPDYSPDAVIDPAIVASVFTLKTPETDDSAWNPEAAMAVAAESDDPAAFYRGICAGRKPGDPATPQAWALPYKYAPSSPPNVFGVRDALARLSEARGLTNKAEAQMTLEKAMKLFSDYAPDDEIDTGLLSAALLLGLEGAR
jgi:ATP-dependent Clp endopeptidase proteolytic subunit ClpP